MNEVCSGEKWKNRKRREMWATKWLLDRDRYTRLNYWILLEISRHSSENFVKNSGLINVLDMLADIVPPSSDKTRTVCVCGRVDTRVWLWDLPHALRANSKPAASRAPNEGPRRAKPESAKSGSWHSTHGQVWLIGTRAQPDSYVYGAPLGSHESNSRWRR